MIGFMYRVKETQEYINWLEGQNLKEQAQIQSRIARIRIDGHFGTARKLDQSLAELKWKSGRRVYFSITLDKDGSIIILLLGGNKNTQSKDIRKAKALIRGLEDEKV